MVFEILLLSITLSIAGLVFGGLAYFLSMIAISKVFNGTDQYTPMIVGGSALAFCLFMFHGFSLNSFIESATSYDEHFMSSIFYMAGHVILITFSGFGLRLGGVFAFKS
jgi:hypothetical protein